MIIVTGGAGFIGSAFIWHLNTVQQQDRIIVIDDLGIQQKWLNLRARQFIDIWPIAGSVEKLEQLSEPITAIVHMGACSTTTEDNADYLIKNNVHYSMSLWQLCCRLRCPFIYASSAATYGDGSQGYEDDEGFLDELKPLNKYGWSKQLFDRWAVSQKQKPPFWIGLKFFNVYGPHEYHKGPQASVIYHAFQQIKETGKVKLFKSYREGIAHGEQKRDFIYIKDVTQVIDHFLQRRQSPNLNGIYNVGTGHARSFLDLARAVFKALGHNQPTIEWIDMPDNIKKQYQYFTQAPIGKLQNKAGYDRPFYSLEAGIQDYIGEYLQNDTFYL